MPIFPTLKLEAKVQVGDKTRLDGTTSFKTDDIGPITQVQIKPEAAGVFITVAVSDPTDPTLWKLDWQYSTAGTKTVSLMITDGVTPVTVTQDIEAVLAVDDYLFSSDKDIIAEEPGILKYVIDGRNSFIDMHRNAQENIMEEIWKNRITSTSGAKLTLAEVLDKSEIKQWSKYMVLASIFNSISNDPGDIFEKKSDHYEKLEDEWQEMAFNVLKLDYNKNGTLEANEELDFRSSVLIKR